MENRLPIFRKYLSDQRDHLASVFSLIQATELEWAVYRSQIELLDDIIHHYDIFVKRGANALED